MNDSASITCPNCQASFVKDELQRSCCNCFCCTGCEIYICPACRQEIIIQPIGQAPRYTIGNSSNSSHPNN